MSAVYTERVDSEDRTQLLQWGISLLLVLVLHFSIALWLFSRDTTVKPEKPPPAAYLDLPPLSAGPLPPLAVPAPPKVTPPAPKIQSVPKPDVQPPAPPKAAPPLPKPDVQPPAPPKAEAPPLPPIKPTAPTVVPPKPAPAPVPKVAPPRPQAPKPAPPQKTQPKAAPTPAPVAPGSATPLYVDPMRDWQIAAARRLEKFKKQSQAATWQGEEGVVGLQITIDRLGNILSAYVSNSSGYSTLDNQAMTMCRLARRLPPLPADFKEPTYNFGVSIEFTLY
jgi:protein TonB